MEGHVLNEPIIESTMNNIKGVIDQIFKQYDDDGNGSLDKDEVR